ncbi:hypothetical protein LWI29_007016 [Acer saccharum]|uniref:RNase H type-1 domain-containing protein n=1 Tax=Acer saccharum TaxID=4024 RepID=A0AA39S7R3_ACESA|nr:hypothetical protein LWI29_007016 [Acer saccharum]
MKAKYIRGGGIPIHDISTSNTCSSTWRGLLYGAKLISNGIQWRVGNGLKIFFWSDVWLPSLGKLQNFALGTLSEDQIKEKVSDYLINNEWNLQKLASVLPGSVVNRIFCIHIASNSSSEDSVIWSLSKNGNFSVSSAYGSHFKMEDDDLWKWSFIWNLKLPPRVTFFLWILLHGKLLTNRHRAARGIAVDLICDSCRVSEEDMDHVFRKCSVSCKIWEDICNDITKNSSYTMEWNSWLWDNLKSNTLLLGCIPGHLLFAVTLWFIWKWRCEKIFIPKFSLPDCPGMIILKFVKDWLDANLSGDSSIVKKNCFIAWSPPPLGWVKLNTDGSWRPEFGSISAGGVIRNNEKAWLVGFALNKGMGNVLEAELWGIFEGLKLAWRAGFRKVLVESDSQSAVLLLTNPTPTHHPLFNIVEDCKMLVEKNWSCSIQHVFRESNRVADALANLGHSLNLGTTFFDVPPAQISACVNEDLSGSALARLLASV